MLEVKTDVAAPADAADVGSRAEVEHRRATTRRPADARRALAAVRRARPVARLTAMTIRQSRPPCQPSIRSSRSQAPRAPARPRSRGRSRTSSAASTSPPPSSRATPSTATTGPRWQAIAEARREGNHHFSHFGAARRTCFASSRSVFRSYGETGRGRTRNYIHDAARGRAVRRADRDLHRLAGFAAGTDLLFYEGLHGAVVTPKVEHRAARRSQDRRRAGDQPRMDPEAAPGQVARAATRTEAVTDTILRAHARLRATTSARSSPRRTSTSSGCRPSTPRTRSSPAGSRLPTKSMVVIRFSDPKGIDFPYLLSMIHD